MRDLPVLYHLKTMTTFLIECLLKSSFTAKLYVLICIMRLARSRSTIAERHPIVSWSVYFFLHILTRVALLAISQIIQGQTRRWLCPGPWLVFYTLFPHLQSSSLCLGKLLMYVQLIQVCSMCGFLRDYHRPTSTIYQDRENCWQYSQRSQRFSC